MFINQFVSVVSLCPQKVDLFSLGIILFEMSYRPMTTGSERISVLSQLRGVSPYLGLGAIRVLLGNLVSMVH